MKRTCSSCGKETNDYVTTCLHCFDDEDLAISSQNKLLQEAIEIIKRLYPHNNFEYIRKFLEKVDD